MKKLLFMCALGLTIATSMVAGTMAIYTHTDVVLENGKATAKKFFINSKAVTDTLNLKLAPGEKSDWKFTVTNVDDAGTVSEVNTDMVIVVNLTELKNWQDFTVDLLDKDGKVIGDGIVENGKVTLSKVNEFIGGTSKTEDYSLRFIWNDKTGALNDDQDTDLVMRDGKVLSDNEIPSTTISVSVTGKQHVDPQQ